MGINIPVVHLLCVNLSFWHSHMISIRTLNSADFKFIDFQGPSVEELRLANPISRRPYLERINIAHNYASAELLDLLINKVTRYLCMT